MLLTTRFASRTPLFTLAVLLSASSVARPAYPPVVAANSNTERPALTSRVDSSVYDLSEAIAAYVSSSSLPADQARDEAVMQLLAPVGQNGFAVKHKEIEPGKFEVWATKSFHSFLPSMIAWMKHGRKQISIETRVVTVPEQALKDLHVKLDEQWEMHTADQEGSNTIEPGTPVTSLSAPAVALATFNEPSTRSTDFITATASSVQSFPTLVARLTEGKTKTLVHELQADTSSNLLQAPKVTIFPGQHAVIKDTVQRPFVVAVKPVQRDKSTAMQPIIKVLEDGLTVQLRASLRDDNQLDIDSEITFRQIGEVDDFTFQSSTLQIPEQHIRQVRLSKTVGDGTTLLIDPHFVKEQTVKRRFRGDVTTRQYTLLFLTPRVIHDAAR